jgi:hypothetical protein
LAGGGHRLLGGTAAKKKRESGGSEQDGIDTEGTAKMSNGRATHGGFLSVLPGGSQDILPYLANRFNRSFSSVDPGNRFSRLLRSVARSKIQHNGRTDKAAGKFETGLFGSPEGPGISDRPSGGFFLCILRNYLMWQVRHIWLWTLLIRSSLG